MLSYIQESSISQLVLNDALGNFDSTKVFEIS